MKIGNVETKNDIILAPMAGVTTAAFRTICLEHHAGLVYAEMVSDKGLVYANNKTLEMIEVEKNDHPIAMQLFGSSADSILAAAKLIEKNSQADIIDLNMGCPVQKIIKAGSGAALLKTPDKIYTIVKTLVDNISLPVTVKIRAGFDHSSINCDKVSKLIEQAGAKAICIHGRTRSDMYNGNANLDYIKMVKETVSIPVIGNGDIKDIESALKMKNETGCDALMIGRAACGNPWIFDELSSFFATGTIIERPSKKDIMQTMLVHTERLITLKGEHVALVEMRTHAAWYLKQLVGTKKYREQIVTVTSYQELVNLATEIINNDLIYVKR